MEKITDWLAETKDSARVNRKVKLEVVDDQESYCVTLIIEMLFGHGTKVVGIGYSEESWDDAFEHAHEQLAEAHDRLWETE